MNNQIITTPRSGPFAGKCVFTDRDGYGIFTERGDGTDIQHTGTGQTPRFRDAKHLARWLRSNYRLEEV